MSKGKELIINVIYTYENRPQQMADIKVKSNITENTLLRKLLHGMTKEEVRELVKISTMQYADEYTAIQHLLKRNGKYYFDEPKLKKWKANYISKME